MSVAMWAWAVLPAAYLTWTALVSPIPGVLALGMGLLTWVWPETALLLIVAMAPLARSPLGQWLPFPLFTLTKGVLVLVFTFVWMVRVSGNRPVHTYPFWLKALGSAWLGLTLLSMLHAQDPVASMPHLTYCFAGAAFFCVVWQAEESLYRKIAIVALCSAMGVTLISILQFLVLKYRILHVLWNFILAPRERLFMNIDWSPIGGHFYRVSGTFPHSNPLGVYYYLVIPFVAAALTLKEVRGWMRYALIISFPLLLIGLYTANCRAGFFAVLISLGYLSLHRGCRWLFGAGAFAGLAVVALYVRDPAAMVSFVETVGRTQHGMSSRGSIWDNALDILKRDPDLGVGPGQFTSYYNADFGLFIFENPKEIFEQSFLLQADRQDLIEGYHAHNTYLQLLCEYGAAALPLFVISIGGILIAAGRRALRLPVGSFGRAMALGTASFCASYLAACFFDSYVTFTRMGLAYLAAPLLILGLRYES